MKRMLLSILACFMFSTFVWTQIEFEIAKLDVTSLNKQNTVITFLEETGEHNTLLKFLEIANLKATLSGSGPFSILAPTDAAFEKLTKQKLETLVLPENLEQLKAILTYHVIPGNVNTSSMSKAITDNNGEANFKTLHGTTIVVFIKEGILAIEDVNGNEALIETSDKQQNNGYVHVVDTVILPN